MWRGPFRPAIDGSRFARHRGMATRRPPRLATACYRGANRYLLTVRTFARESLFTEAHIVELARSELMRTASAYGFEIIAYCFMPDHLHAFVESTSDHADFLKLVSMYKQRSGREYRRRTGQRLWQDSFHDRVLRSEDRSVDVAAYVVANPVTAGLCTDASTYPYLGSQR